MKLHMFAIRDIATTQFGNPMFLMTKGQAIRGFTDEVNRKDENNMLNKHPEDYELYELGTFETEAGTFETSSPKQVITGKEVITK